MGKVMMVEVKNVSLVIKGKTILDHIDLSLEKGKIYGLIGRNGSGKTVLMKCICGFMHPTEGKIIVSGKTIGKDCDFPPNTGIIIETPEFYPYFTGLHNLKSLAAMKGKIKSQRIKEVIKEVNGITYTMLSYTEHTNGIPVPSGKSYLVNVYNKDTQIVELTKQENYSSWTGFSNNWDIKTIDGIPRIPVLKFMDFEYTNISNITLNQVLNKKVSNFHLILKISHNGQFYHYSITLYILIHRDLYLFQNHAFGY